MSTHTPRISHESCRPADALLFHQQQQQHRPNSKPLGVSPSFVFLNSHRMKVRYDFGGRLTIAFLCVSWCCSYMVWVLWGPGKHAACNEAPYHAPWRQ